MSRPRRLVLVVASCMVFTACSLAEKVLEVRKSADRAQAKIGAEHRAFDRAVAGEGERQAAQEVDRPWIAGRPVPLGRDVTLPSALRANVRTTMLFAGGPVDLRQAAGRITAATSIPVFVRPDALLPLERFLPRLSGEVSTPAASGGVSAEVMMGLPAREAEPLADILDRIGARLGVQWRYTAGRIEFFRTETRVFDVRALALNASAQASLGLEGRGKQQGFVSSSRTRLEGGEQNPMKAIHARLEPFLTRAGILVAQPGAGASVVVTDTPDVLRRIATYLDAENRALTRRIRLVFEEITLATDDSAEAGIDWNVVFTDARLAASLSIAAPVAAEAARMALGATHGNFQGSEAVIRALSKVGRVVRRSSVPVLTLNRRPVTHAVRTTFSYIDQVQTTALANGSGLALPSVSVSQRDETVGSVLTLVPDAQDNNQILLSVAYDNTVAQPLKSVTFGDRSNPLQLQQITIDGNGTVQQVLLHPGQPLVISGFDRKQEQSEGRRLNPGLPAILGGSDQASKQRLMTVIIMSAQVEEDA
ncbi:MAG TPA: hypothetical protein VFR20_08355 [Burkholderiaceae bacterium]|nr:hypothetical protein [Burkholderiaceae bacterium]